MSGDLIKFDDQGWCYFVERVGDCYRWKGENVSAQAVESELRKHTGLTCSLVVIGLKLDNFDGYPPMIALDTEPTVENVESLTKAVAKLPRSQRPVLVRWMKEPMPLTPTFKIKREELKRAALDNMDEIHVIDAGSIRPMSSEDLAMIKQGTFKL